MAPRHRDDVLAEEWVSGRELRMTGRSDQAYQLAERIAESADPDQVTQALIAQLAIRHAERNQRALLELLHRVEEWLGPTPHPRLAGEYHIFAAVSAYDLHSFGIALRHAVEADRALQRMNEKTRAAVDAWQDLAAVYIVLGYYERAGKAAQRGESLCAEAGLPPAYGLAVYAYVHAAVNNDQSGDTAGCIRELTKVVERAGPMAADLPLRNQVMLGYAVRRLGALGQPMALDVPVAIDLNPNLNRIRILGKVCEALAVRRTHHALEVLDTASDPLDVSGLEPSNSVLQVWNCWRGRRGQTNAWIGNSGLICESPSGPIYRFRGSDGPGKVDFHAIAFTVELIDDLCRVKRAS